MTPVPRTPGDETVSALSVLAAQLATLQSSVTQGFRDLTGEISKLRDESVTQREYDRFTSNLRVDWAEAEQKHDKDVKELREEHDKAASRAASNRKWLWTAAISGLAALGTAIGAVATAIEVASKIH